MFVIWETTGNLIYFRNFIYNCSVGRAIFLLDHVQEKEPSFRASVNHVKSIWLNRDWKKSHSNSGK